MENLTPLFSKQSDITFIYDCELLGEWLSSKKIPSFHIDDEFSSSNLISIQTSLHHYRKIYERTLETDAYAVNVPLLSFDCSFSAAKYVCERILETDFEKAYHFHQAVINALSVHDNPVKIKNTLVDLECSFSDNVHYVYPKTLQMPKDEHTRSLLEYLEIHFEHTDITLPAEYHINGRLMLAGALCASSPNALEIRNTTGKVHDMNRLINALAFSDKAWLEIENNMVTSLIVDGKNYTELLESLSGDKRGLSVTELAFGLNKEIRQHANWLINSPINEGARGIHIGIGDGSSGIHIDLVSHDLDLTTLL